MNKKITKYPLDEYKEKLEKRLQSLKEREEPGQGNGLKTRTQILHSLYEPIKQLAKEGYTAAQIAQALSDDTFAILPKMVTNTLALQKRRLKVNNSSGNVKKKSQPPPKESDEIKLDNSIDKSKKTLTPVLGASIQPPNTTKPNYPKNKMTFIEDID